MKKLLDAADQYLEECDWIDIAMIKLCLCAFGIMIGLCVSRKHKKMVFAGALLAFTATYIPLLVKFIPFLAGKIPNIEEKA